MKQQRGHALRDSNGFTLIELLVVIAVIGILASVIMASLSNARAKARDAKRVADLQQVYLALELFYNENGYYPPSSCGWDCNGYDYSTETTWSTLQSYLSPYISKLPVDPINNIYGPWVDGSYSYAYGNVSKDAYPAQYDLTAQLETNSPLRCAVRHYKFFFNNGIDWCGSYSGQIYEASQ